MKKTLLTTASAIALAVIFADSAIAGCDGVYLAGRGGAVEHRIDKNLSGTDNNDEYKTMLSGALGYRYGYFRTELEYVWRNDLHEKGASGVGSWELETASYMWNTYWDVAPYAWFTPYLSVGIGLSSIKETNKTRDWFEPTKDEHLKFTYAIGGGMSAQVTNRLNIDAGYRFYDFGKLRSSKIKAHEIYGGIRYVF